MHICLSKTASILKRLSYNCTVPIEAYERMKGNIKAAELYLTKLITRNMYDNLITLRIGTSPVEAIVKQIYNTNYRNPTEVVRIMKIKVKSIEKELRYLKHSWQEKNRNMKQYLTSHNIRNQYYDIEKKHREYVWNTNKKESRRRTTFLKEKIYQQKKKPSNTYDFFKLNDEDLQDVEQTNISDNFEVYGDVTISEAEKQCLELGPKFMQTPKLDREHFEVEIEMENIKTRMELIKYQDIGDLETVTEEELLAEEQADRDKRTIFDPNTKVLNMSKKRVTDAKYNTRSFLPRMIDVENESKIYVRKQELLREFKSHMEKNCKKSGEQKENNMSSLQTEGKFSLQNRVKSGEIVVTNTDKSGKFAVLSSEEYKKACRVHITDKEVEWKQVEETETLLNRHSLQIVKALNMGTKHGKDGQQTRVHKAYTSIDAKPGPLFVLIKDHKKKKPGETVPPTRPVCSAKGDPGSRLSNLLSTILNKISDAANSTTECMSTEEARRNILMTNRKIASRIEEDPGYLEHAKDMMLLSMDVKALYPSLRINEVGPIVFKEIVKIQEEDKLVFGDVNWREVGKYLAITCNKEEIDTLGINTAIPEKRTGDKARGRKPGPAYWENDTVKITKDGVSKVEPKWKEAKTPTPEQKIIMISKLMEKAVLTSMKNHVYRFDGKVYKQEDGGPIGDELAQAVARMVMLWWDRQFIGLCDRLKIDMLMYMRYVDDTNKVIVPPPVGTRFVQGKLEIVPEKIEEDRDRDRDKVTGELMRDIANSISPMLQFEEDTGSNHTDGCLPILDLKVWKEVKEDTITIKHSFYKKPMASKFTIRAGTAYPISQIRSIMIEEVLRRLRNCSPESSWEEKGEHLTVFASELKNSGHSEHFRSIIFKRALNVYKKELDMHNSGKKDIYRSRSERNKEKGNKGGKQTKDNWYKKKKSNKKTEGRTVSILQIPFAQNLKEAVEKITNDKKKSIGNFKTKVQETGGDRLQFALVRPDPFPRKTCGREKCPITTDDKECRERCFQGHVNYRIKCIKCEKARLLSMVTDPDRRDHPPEFAYHGETSRGCYTRYSQHKEDYKRKEGILWEHAQEHHDGEQNNIYSMTQESIDKDPMRRVVRESVKITATRAIERKRKRKSGQFVLMNRKNEWFGVQTVGQHFTQE